MRRWSALLTLVLASSAQAQQAPEVSPQLALARICASEAGLRVTDDCAAIYAVLTRAGRDRFLERARAYSRSTFDVGRVDERAWVVHLRPDGEQPQGWPVERVARTRRDEQGRRTVSYVAPPPWSRYRRQWLELYAHAGQILAGRVEHRCETEPQDWGGDMDTARYVSRNPNARRVNCGQTHNTFWLQNAPVEQP